MLRARDVARMLARFAFYRLLHRLGLCRCQQRVWGEYDGPIGSELIPLNDVLAHERGDGCACLPQVAYRDGADGDEWTVLHHAWDGRE